MDVILKSYNPNNYWGRLKGFVRTSRAKKCWYAANALHQRRIPTAMPLACVSQKRWGRVSKSYFFYEYVPDASVLTLYLENRFRSPLSPEERQAKRKLITQFAHFVNRLHGLWIYHGDLKASNILIKELGPSDFEFYLIDLDHVKVCCYLNLYQRYRNIMQLNKSFLDRKCISMTDRLGFLHTYLRFSSRNKRTVRQAWNIVSFLTSLRLRKTEKAFSS